MRHALATVKAAYDHLGRDEPSWLKALATSAQPWMDCGMGTMAWTFDMSLGHAPRLGDPIVVGGDPSWESVPAEIMATLPEAALNAYRFAPPHASASEALGQPLVGYLPMHASDFLAVRACLGDGRGVVIGAFAQHAQQKVRRDRVILGRVAAHLASAYRLRCSGHEAAGFEGSRVEAIFTPAGSCVEARGDTRGRAVRSVLREEILSWERRRDRTQKIDSDGALQLWRSLVAGRWSICDRMDTDGKRYIVAIRNPPEGAALRALTQHESQIVGLAVWGGSNKYIAYAMGLSEGTVSLYLSTAMHKLGVRSRAELVTLYAALSSKSPNR